MNSVEVKNTDESELYVITRTGKKELLNPNKITERLQKLINKHPKIPHVNPFELMLAVTSNLRSNITTYEIDEYAGNAAASLSVSSPYYLKLAARIIIDNHQKNTSRSFVDKMQQAYLRRNVHGIIDPLLDEEYFKYVELYQDQIEAMIDYSRDFIFEFFGFRVFQGLYGLKINGKCIERPQDLFMRVAIALNMHTYTDKNNNDPDFTSDNVKRELEKIRITYNALSNKLYTQATPTLFNAGLKYHQYASCFLLGMDDSAESIMDIAKSCALTSKRGGGIGIHIHKIRSESMQISSTGGQSSGIVPFLKIINDVMLGFNQGGKRPGSAAIYIMPHHPDIVKFLQLKLPTGVDKERARDLFYALWIPNIFMERVLADGPWSLFDPHLTGDLSEFYDDKTLPLDQQYTTKYLQLEKDKKYIKQIPAREIWKLVFEANKIKGSVYLCFSDHVNSMSMHKNIGTVKSSNLCVSGKTQVLTQNGYQRIDNLCSGKGQHIIWNGKEWAFAQFAKTSEMASLIEIELSNGLRLECTSDHKFNVIKNKKEVQLAIKDIKEGDQFVTCVMPSIDTAKCSMKANLARLQKEIDRATNTDTELIIPYDSYEQAMQTALLLNTLGSSCKIEAENSSIEKNEDTKYLVLLQASKLSHLLEHIKFKTLPIKTLPVKYNNITLVSKKAIDSAPTYCFNEPKQHMGVFNGIYASNCSEIVLYSDHKEFAVCTLSSINLQACVVDSATDDADNKNTDTIELNHEFPNNPKFDFQKLIDIVKIATYNTNNIIDKNHYPTPESRRGSLLHRPIGIGMQGLADTYMKMRYPFDSPQARALNKMIAETMYYAALSESTRICRKEYLHLKKKCALEGKVIITTYEQNSFNPINITYTHPEDIPKNVAAYPSMNWNGGSPISKGVFHWELYGLEEKDLSGNYDWSVLREHIREYGVKNSLLIALMPTASTSSFLGNNECFEPVTSNIYSRSTISGEFVMINKWMIYDLYKMRIWDTNLKDYLLACDGSIQHIDGIPDELKQLYKTAWEIDQAELVQQAIDRQPFVDQAQSLNWYLSKVTQKKFNELSFMAWRGKLKTGKYYLHSKPEIAPQKFSIAPELQQKMLEKIKGVNVKFVAKSETPTCDLCSA